jgi:hypothetical protein
VESIPPTYEVLRAGTSNWVIVPARQAGNRFLGSLKGLQIPALLYTPWWWVRLEGLPKWEAGRYMALLLLPSEGGRGQVRGWKLLPPLPEQRSQRCTPRHLNQSAQF